jgi:serine/threonine-protein kinase
MQDSESTSGKLSEALLEDLALERDRLRTLFAERFEDGGFLRPEFCRAVLELVQAEGKLPMLAGLAGPWLGDASAERFEECYRARLDAGSGSTADTSGLGNALPLDVFEYLDAALSKRLPGHTVQVMPDAARVEGLLRFLKAATDDPSLVLFRKDIPEMPPAQEAAPSVSSEGAETPPPSERILRTVGPYHILEELGRGGMGSVHLAYHTLLRKRFAIKILRNLPAEGEDRERAVRRFTREARIYHELTNPNIVRLHEIFPHEGELLIVMEYVDGPNLRKLIAGSRRLPAEQVVAIGIDVAEALQAARAKGIVHRDPKPENILVTPEGRYKITDFGIARIVRETEETRVTEEKSVLGTVGYMSPEAVRGEEVDELADIYSLGAVLYHAATGVIPCYSPDPSSMMYLTLHKAPRAISVTVEGFPSVLEAIILRCLRKEKRDRFAGYPELLDALYDARKGLSTGPTKHLRPKRRVLVPALCAIIVLAILIWRVLPRQEETVHQPPPLKLAGTARPPEAVVDPPKPKPPGFEQVPVPELPAPARIAADAPKPSSPPVPSLREKLLASPAGPGAVRSIEEILHCLERHYPELAAFNLGNLSEDLAHVQAPSDLTGADRAFRESILRAASRMVDQARGAFRARLEELKSSKGPVTLSLRVGGAAVGVFDGETPTGAVLRGEGGVRLPVDYARISPEEFRPKASPPEGELAFEALLDSPSKALALVLPLSGKNEELLFWVPSLVRLARLEVEALARKAAEEAKPMLLDGRSPDRSAAVLASSSSVRAAGDRLLREEGNLLPLFSFLEADFRKAARELEALELLFHRQYSALASGFRETSGGRAGADLLLDLFEKDLASGADELLSGTGWFNWRWELRPGDKDPLVRAGYLVPGPAEGPLTLQDPEGPRSLVMNDAGSRAPEGVLLRVKLEPLGQGPDRAEWRFHLVSEKPGTTFLRVTRGAIALCRSTLTPGTPDEKVVEHPLPPAPEDRSYRTIALVPGQDSLHVYVDRELLLSIPLPEGAIPHQLSITVTHAKASIRTLEVKASPGQGGGARK